MARKRVVSRNVKNICATAVIYNIKENTFTEKEVYYPKTISEDEKKTEIFISSVLGLEPHEKLLELLNKTTLDCYMWMSEVDYYRGAKTAEKR